MIFVNGSHFGAENVLLVYDINGSLEDEIVEKVDEQVSAVDVQQVGTDD